MSLIVIVIVLVLLFGGGGFYGHRQGYYGGGGFGGILGVLVIVLICLFLFGGLGTHPVGPYRDYDVTASAAPGPAAVGKLKFGNDFNHSLLIGVRYNFGAPTPATPAAPAPVASPAPAAARSYLVFFDWDKAALTDRARSIVKEAAENSTRVQMTRIEVNGYTDTSGTPRYNQGLSVRRARSVAAELIRDGVPQAAINIQGLGETNLLVPTGAGVREPQNRRVEIIIR